MKKITLAHGSGGKIMHELIDSLFIREFDNPVLREKKDSAILDIGGKKIAFTTDSYVVNPIFFPGGDIGSLAVYGTVNDLAVCGAKAVAISVGMILEDGFSSSYLEKIVRSIARAAKESGVRIVTGDTKVVEKGSCDKIFINTSGVGEVYYSALSVKNIRAGDSVIISGGIGEHAVSVLSKREGLAFKSRVKSDSAPLNGLVAKILKISKKVKFMRDPTRGGVATTLNEIVLGRNFGIAINEKDVPLTEGVRSACELLGLDPLYLACEGRAIIIAAKEDAGIILDSLRHDKNSKMAEVIGSVSPDHKGKVYVNTIAGGKRFAGMLAGEQLPRIC